MLNVAASVKIYVYAAVADMRKGINGLSGIVRSEFDGADPTDGSLFVFMNRRRDRLKILQFADGGYWLYYRVLEQGTFESLAAPDSNAVVSIDSTELAMLLSGVSLVGSQQRRKRFALPASPAA